MLQGEILTTGSILLTGSRVSNEHIMNPGGQRGSKSMLQILELEDAHFMDYAIVENPSLDTWMQNGHDHIMLKRFDIDCIRTIGSVLGQSIALNYFVRQVDGMGVEFIDLNRGMEKTGTFTMKCKKLFQLVGKENSNLADVILKLGLFERSDVAWKNAKYAQIWEYLRDEYKLTQRFGSLDYKLKFVEHNVRYFLEILQNRKSDFLEWIIIFFDKSRNINWCL